MRLVPRARKSEREVLPLAVMMMIIITITIIGSNRHDSPSASMGLIYFQTLSPVVVRVSCAETNC